MIHDIQQLYGHMYTESLSARSARVPGTLREAHDHHPRRSLQAPLPSHHLARPGECIWECAPQSDNLLPPALPCSPVLLDSIGNIYADSISSNEWSRVPIPLRVGVYQGDPLSPIIFNTVTSTLADSLKAHNQCGYTLSQTAQLL